jgi:hypothetical protein
MAQPLADGLAVLYVLCRDWMAGRDLLATLGVKDPDRLDTLLGLDDVPTSAATGRAGRRAQVAAMGGEIA